MAEALVDAVDPHPGQRVLDVACGSGNAALVAERRYCDVTGIDYVPELVERATLRAQANGQHVEFQVGDTQYLPFPDDRFDGSSRCMVCNFPQINRRRRVNYAESANPAAKLASQGRSLMDRVVGGSPPMPSTYPRNRGVESPLRWGTSEGIAELLGSETSSIQSERCKALQYYRSVDHAIEVFSTYFGPTIRALETIDPAEEESLLADLALIMHRYNRASDGTAIIENQYLQTIAIAA